MLRRPTAYVILVGHSFVFKGDRDPILLGLEVHPAAAFNRGGRTCVTF